MQRVQTLEDAWAHKTREDAEKALAVAEKKIKRLETELAKQEEELTQKETEVFVLREVCGAHTVVALCHCTDYAQPLSLVSACSLVTLDAALGSQAVCFQAAKSDAHEKDALRKHAYDALGHHGAAPCDTDGDGVISQAELDQAAAQAEAEANAVDAGAVCALIECARAECVG